MIIKEILNSLAQHGQPAVGKVFWRQRPLQLGRALTCRAAVLGEAVFRDVWEVLTDLLCLELCTFSGCEACGDPVNKHRSVRNS